jgi:hypothetical protein
MTKAATSRPSAAQEISPACTATSGEPPTKPDRTSVPPLPDTLDADLDGLVHLTAQSVTLDAAWCSADRIGDVTLRTCLPRLGAE